MTIMLQEIAAKYNEHNTLKLCYTHIATLVLMQYKMLILVYA